MTSTKIEEILRSFNKNAGLQLNLDLYDKLRKEMEQLIQASGISDKIQKELKNQIKLHLTSEDGELCRTAIETWVLLLKGRKCIDDDFINVIYGNDKHDITKCIVSLYSFLITENSLELDKLLMISVNMGVRKKILDSIQESSANIPQDIFFKFITENVLNLIFKTSDNNLRKILIEFVLSVKGKCPISVRKYESIGSLFKESYLLDVEALRQKNNKDWYNLCIFIMEFCGTLLHSEIELTNAILRNIEIGFKTRTVEDRLASYECWKVLIENCSLDRNYLICNKQLRLLVKPLKIKLSKHEDVIAKRFVVWAHLIQVLQKHAVFCLGDYLQYCYGPINASTIVELVPITSDVIKHTWRLQTDVLMNIIGHYGHIKSCITGSNFKLEEAFISGSNFMEFDYLILNSVRLCCERILLWENKTSRAEKIKCLWGSLFSVFQNIEDKYKEDVLNKVFTQIIYILNKSFSNSDYFEDLLKNIFEVFASFEKPICDTILLNQIIVFPTLKSMISYSDLSQERINLMVDVAKYTGKFSNKLDYFNDACVFLNSCDHKKNDCMLSLELWLHFADVLYAVCKTPRDSFDAFESNAKFLMSWIFKYIFPSYLSNKIMDKWRDVLLELSAISPYCKEQLLREYEKVIKDNPNLIPDIVAFLPIFTQFGLDEKFNKTCGPILVSLTLECLKHPCVSKPKINLLISTVKKCMELCVKLDNSDFESVSDKLMQCFVHLLHPHQAYEILISMKAYFSKIPENIKQKIPSSLVNILNDLVGNSDVTISNDAALVLKVLEKETKPERCTFVQPVVSSRTARIANMAKGATSTSPTTSFFRHFGKDIDSTSSVRVKGSQINNSPSSRAKKIYAKSRISKGSKGIDEDDSKDFVLIEKEVTLNKSKMNEHQKEMLKKRREDIPALYQDLSQSQHSNPMDNSMDHRSISADNEAFGNINNGINKCSKLEEEISAVCNKSPTSDKEPKSLTTSCNHSDSGSRHITVDESAEKEIKSTPIKSRDQTEVREQNKCHELNKDVNPIKYVLSDQHDVDNLIHNEHFPSDNKIENIANTKSLSTPEDELCGVVKSFTDDIQTPINSVKTEITIREKNTHIGPQNSSNNLEKIYSITSISGCDKNKHLVPDLNSSECILHQQNNETKNISIINSATIVSQNIPGDIKLNIEDKKNNILTLDGDVPKLFENCLQTLDCNESELTENVGVTELLKDNDRMQIDNNHLFEYTDDDVFAAALSKSVEDKILSDDKFSKVPNENFLTSDNCLSTPNLKRKRRTQISVLCTQEDQMQQVNLRPTRSAIKLNTEQTRSRSSTVQNQNADCNDKLRKPQSKRHKIGPSRKLQLKCHGNKVEKDSDHSKIDSTVYNDSSNDIQKNTSTQSKTYKKILKPKDRVKDDAKNISVNSEDSKSKCTIGHNDLSNEKATQSWEKCSNEEPLIVRYSSDCKSTDNAANILITTNINKRISQSNVPQTKSYTKNIGLEEIGECKIDEGTKCEALSAESARKIEGSLHSSSVDHFDGDIIKQLEAEICKIDENLHGDSSKQFRADNDLLLHTGTHDKSNAMGDSFQGLLSSKINGSEDDTVTHLTKENCNLLGNSGSMCGEMPDDADVPKHNTIIKATEQNVSKEIFTFTNEETDSNSFDKISGKKLQNELKRIQMDIVGADLFVRSSRKRQSFNRKSYSSEKRKATKLETKELRPDKTNMTLNIVNSAIGDKLENDELPVNILAYNEFKKSINNDTVNTSKYNQFEITYVVDDQESCDTNLSLQSRQQKMSKSALDANKKKENVKILRTSSARSKTPDSVNKPKKRTPLDKQSGLETTRKSKRSSTKNYSGPEKTIECQQTLELNSEDIVESSQETFNNDITQKSACLHRMKTDSPKRSIDYSKKLLTSKCEYLNSNTTALVKSSVELVELDGSNNASNDIILKYDQDKSNFKLNKNVPVVNETVTENMSKALEKSIVAAEIDISKTSTEKPKINLINTYSENLFDSPDHSPESNQNYANKIAIAIDDTKDDSTSQNIDNEKESNDALTESCNPDETVSLEICNANDLIKINSTPRPSLLGNINIDSLPIGFETPKKQNLPTSPICDDTPDRNSELLCNTLDISPIKINEVKDDGVIVLDLEEKSSRDFPTTECDGSERLVHKNITAIISDCLPTKENSLIKKPSSRSAKLLNLIPNSTFHLQSPKRIIKKTCTTRISSPTTDRIRKMMLNCGDNVKIPSINYDDDVQIAENDVLSFSRHIPSPLATPNCGILKRKASEVIDEEAFPFPKRKRVNFSDPPTSCKKIYFKEHEEYKQNFKKSFKKISLKIDTKSMAKEVPESEESSCSLISDLCFVKAESIYPPLINCDVNINAIKEFSNAEDLIQNFYSIDVTTIGDLAKLNASQVNQLEFLENPKLIVVMDALDSFYMSYKEEGYMSTLGKAGHTMKDEIELAPDASIKYSQTPIYPELVECSDTIQNILKLFGNTKTAKDFRKKNITTVGQLAKLSRQEVCELHVKLPKVTYVINALNKYHRKLKNKRIIAQQMNEELVEEIRSMIQVHDARNESTMTSIKDDESKRNDETVVEISDENTRNVHENLCFTPKRNDIGVIQNVLSNKIDEAILSLSNYRMDESRSPDVINVIDICTQEDDIGYKHLEVPSTDVTEMKVQDNIFMKKCSRTELVDYIKRQYSIEEVKDIYEDLGRIIGVERK